MTKLHSGVLVVAQALLIAASAFGQLTVRTEAGKVHGASANGIVSFKGIPFAQPPVGDLRWRAPQPAKPWSGVHEAVNFGARCIQADVSTDQVPRASSLSEDCLYLNVWTPGVKADVKLPVLVYIYGGGFQSGDGSESRYDGEALAKQGMVVVTINYRLGALGYLALPELTKESPQHVSGNYGLLDQTLALQWVQKNIATFGGDPQKVTIAGESAGSMSVSAQMASPLAKGLFARAIGESGIMMILTFPVPTLATAEQKGLKFEHEAGVESLAALRAMPALAVRAVKPPPPAAGSAGRTPRLRFMPNVDGYFFPKSPGEIYAAGEQSHVPLLAGSNSEEGGAYGLLGMDDPTVENYKKALKVRFPQSADEAFRNYSVSADGAPVLDAAQALSGAGAIAFQNISNRRKR